ncbi:MAG: tRNA (adenosine(37)-N6)-threonylcarbamoyltransferase complex ATPase subunit type 1 TsaE [Thermodesulfobacteriota bacterium]
MLQSKNPSETIRIGRRIGRNLHRGDVVALVGELGVGKTQLIKGLVSGIGGVKSYALTSPSFVLINEYLGKIPFYHIDLFRVNEEREAEELGIEEYLQGEGITAIEWADKIPNLLPPELLWIHLYYTGEKSRLIECIAKGERYEEILKELED